MKYDYLIEYNNINKPFIRIVYNDENGKTVGAVINIEKVTKGVFENATDLATGIKNQFHTEGKTCLLLLNVEEVFAYSTSYSKLNLKKSKKLYDASMQESYPDLSNYKLIDYEEDTNDGSFYNRIFVSNYLFDFFNSFMMDLGINYYRYDLLGNYLLAEYRKLKYNNYLILFKDNGLLCGYLVRNGRLINSLTRSDSKQGCRQIIIELLESYETKYPFMEVNTIVSNDEIEELSEYNIVIEPYRLVLADYEGYKI